MGASWPGERDAAGADGPFGEQPGDGSGGLGGVHRHVDLAGGELDTVPGAVGGEDGRRRAIEREGDAVRSTPADSRSVGKLILAEHEPAGV